MKLVFSQCVWKMEGPLESGFKMVHWPRSAFWTLVLMVIHQKVLYCSVYPESPPLAHVNVQISISHSFVKVLRVGWKLLKTISTVNNAYLAQTKFWKRYLCVFQLLFHPIHFHVSVKYIQELFLDYNYSTLALSHHFSILHCMIKQFFFFKIVISVIWFNTSCYCSPQEPERSVWKLVSKLPPS